MTPQPNFCGPAVVHAFTSRTNLRVVRSTENGVEVLFETGDLRGPPVAQAKNLARVKKDLAEVQREEPDAGWRLQTRGTKADWHNFADEGAR